MIDSYGNNVFLINKLPVKGASTVNEDGSYTIFIRAQLSCEERRKSYLHELKHILRDDFYGSDVQQIEASAHQE